MIPHLYNTVKNSYPDAIVLIGTGDYRNYNYKTYQDDAIRAADILGSLLIKVDGHSETGFSKEQFDLSLQKLIRAGYRVAVCDDVTKQKS